MKSKKIIDKRNEMFSLLEESLNKNNLTLYMYFNEDPKFKLKVKIIDGKPQGLLNERQINQFKSIDFDNIYNNLSGTFQDGDFARNDFKGSYEIIKKGINSNTGVSLNSLCAGMFGPLVNTERGTQIYNSHIYMYFKVEEIIKIHAKFKGLLEDYDKTYINPNDLAKLMLNEEDTNYWWLNANPNIWEYSNINEDEIVSYTIYNEKGNKRRIHQNFLDAKPGDKFIGYETSPTKKAVALGEIVANDDKKIYFKKLKDIEYPIDYDELKENKGLEDMEFFKSHQGSFFKVTKAEYEEISNIIKNQNLNIIEKVYEPYNKKDFLDEVFISEESYDTVTALLKRKKNIILQGPPGVGKTFIAKRLAYSIIGEKDDSKIEMIQFHQSYSYEDFIMGYRPSGSGFELREGPFYKFCKKAEEDLENDYYFIIDEINRGNLSKIFGELMMLVENDKRGQELKLTYSDKLFSVPENLYIIGMMNTADRSLAIIDYALRRRFSFFDIEPAFGSKGFKDLLIKGGMDEALIQNIKTRINYINSEIENDVNLGKGFKIGHSYFCDYEDRDDWYEEVIRYEIAPLIREYWFDEEDKARRYIEDLLG